MKPEMLKPKQTFFDKIKEFNNPAEGTAAKDVKDQTDVAYYSYINNLLGGIPEKMAKTGNTEAYKKYQAAKEKYKNIAMQGDIAAAFTPTAVGNLANAKLIGQAGKYASKLPGIVSKGITGLKTGALLGLEQVAPRFATGQMNAKDAAGNVGLSAGLGGAANAVGAGLGWVGERIPDALREASEWGNKTILKTGNVQNRIMNQQKKFMGKDKAKYVKEMAQGMLDKQLHRKSKLDAFQDVVDNDWKKTADIFDAANIKTANAVNEITQNPTVANVLARDPNKMAELNVLMSKVDNSKNFYEKRKFLQDIVYQQGGDNEAKNLARGVLDFIENKSDEMATAQMPELKKDYKLKQLFSKADEREDINVSGAGLKSGSDTAAKIALGSIVGGGGAIAPVNDIKQDPTDVGAWQRLGMAILGGSITSAMSKQIAFNAAKLARKLDPDDIIDMMKSGKIKKIADLASKVDLPAMAGGAVQAGQRFLSGRLSDPEEMPAETPVPDEYEPPNKEELLAEAPVKPAVNDKLMAKIDKKLMQIYAEKYSDAISWEDFHAKVEKLTDGFEPVKAGKILFSDPKQRAKFTRDYKAAQKLKGYSEAYAPEPGLFEKIGNFGEPGKSKEQRAFDQKEIVDTIGTLTAKDGSLPTDTDLKKIALDLKTISALKKTPEEKQAILMQKLQDFYGLDVESLRVLGLV